MNNEPLRSFQIKNENSPAPALIKQKPDVITDGCIDCLCVNMALMTIGSILAKNAGFQYVLERYVVLMDQSLSYYTRVSPIPVATYVRCESDESKDDHADFGRST